MKKTINGYNIDIDHKTMIPIGDEVNSYLLYGKEKIQDYANELSDDLRNAYIECRDYAKIKAKNEFYTRRYFLWHSLDNMGSKENKVTIILLNPAFACSDFLDDTLQRVKNLLEGEMKQFKSYSSFAVLNLTSIRQPKGWCIKRLLDIYKPQEDDKNFIEQYINANLNSNMDYILAWGNNERKIVCDNNKMSQLVLKYLMSAKKKNANINLYIYLDRLTGKANPPHFNQQGFNVMKKKYNDIKIHLTPVDVSNSNGLCELSII